MATAMVMRTGPGHQPAERTISPPKLSAAARNAPENHKAARLRLSNRATARKTADCSRHKATMIQEMRTAPLIAIHPPKGAARDRKPELVATTFWRFPSVIPYGGLRKRVCGNRSAPVPLILTTQQRGETAMAQVLTDLADIRQWTEARGGNPIMADMPDVGGKDQ